MSAPGVLPADVIVGMLANVSGMQVPPASDANLFSGPEQPPGPYIPHAAVFCVGYGGSYPITLLGVSQDIRGFDVQVLVRGEPDNYANAQSLAYTLWQSLQRVTAPSAGYIDVLCKQSGPIYLGQDDTEHPRFTINVQLRYQG